MKMLMGVILLSAIGFAAALYSAPQLFTQAAYSWLKQEFDAAPEISSRALNQLIDPFPLNNAPETASTAPAANSAADAVVLVDVRTPQERAVSMLPGAIDSEFFEQHQDAYLNKKIIVYCTIGYRSGFYTQTLRERGFDAYNLREGILGWTHINGKLVDAHNRPTRQVHVYSSNWRFAVRDYDAVY